MGFPGGASGKESTCPCRRHKRCGLDPWAGKIPWRRKWQPTPVFLPGKFLRQRSLMGYSPRDCNQIELSARTHMTLQHPNQSPNATVPAGTLSQGHKNWLLAHERGWLSLSWPPVLTSSPVLTNSILCSFCLMSGNSFPSHTQTMTCMTPFSPQSVLLSDVASSGTIPAPQCISPTISSLFSRSISTTRCGTFPCFFVPALSQL